MDDFVRNFLVKMGMTSTLEKFEAEWYELEATGRLNMEGMPQVPDVYNTNQELNGTVMSLKRELQNAKQVAHKAQSTWDKFRKERDFHRLHHKRIGQEKNKLLDDIKKLRKHYAQYEPTIKELKRKYELAMKEKMLVRIDRDRMADKLEQFEIEQEKKEKEAKKAERARQKAAEKAESARKKKEEEAAAIQAAAKAGGAAPKATQQAAASPGVQMAPKGRVFEEEKPEPCPVENFNLNKTFKGHQMSVSNLALHPRKAIIATDDGIGQRLGPKDTSKTPDEAAFLKKAIAENQHLHDLVSLSQTDIDAMVSVAYKQQVRVNDILMHEG